MKRNDSVRPSLALVACVSAVAFMVVGAAFIGLTGPGHDEAAHAVVAARWLLPRVRPNDTSWLPWMQSSYMGALKSWFFVPVFAVLGVSVESMRLTTLAFGAAAAAGLCLLAATLYGWELGLTAGLLAATDPALILGASHDTGPAALSVALKLWGLWACARWQRGGNRAWLAAAGVLFGLGVWDKSHFLWFLVAFAALVPLSLGRRPKSREVLPLAAGLVVGGAPWLWFNLTHPLATFRDPGHQGWPLAQHVHGLFGRWLPFRLKMYVESADGADALAAITAVPRRFLQGPTTMAAAAQAVIMLILAAVLVLRRKAKTLRPAGYWLCLLALILTAAILSPLPVKGHHLYMAYPFGLLVLLAVLSAAREHAGLTRGGVLALCAVLVGQQAAALLLSRYDLEKTHGSPYFYHGVDDLSAWLKTNAGDAPVYAMPRLAGPILIASHGAVDAREVEAGDLTTEAGRFAFLRRPGALVVWRAAPFVYDDEDADLPAKAAQALGATLERAASFPYSDGRTWAVVDRVVGAAPGDAVTAEEHLERGNAAYFAKDYAAAEREFLAAATGDARDPSPWLSLGTVRAANGDRAGAVKALDEAVRLAKSRGGKVLDDARKARAELDGAR